MQGLAYLACCDLFYLCEVTQGFNAKTLFLSHLKQFGKWFCECKYHLNCHVFSIFCIKRMRVFVRGKPFQSVRIFDPTQNIFKMLHSWAGSWLCPQTLD